MSKSRGLTSADRTEEEYRSRYDLALLYRILDKLKMTDLIYTHISARVPNSPDHFLINRFGVLFHEMQPDTLVKIDLDGNVVEEDASADDVINRAGFVIHSAIHDARHDAMCVVHTHTTAGIGVSAQKDGLLPISQHALKFYGRLAYHEFEGIAFDLEERERLIADLGAEKAMILRNHGLLATGRSISEAFNTIYFLERACQAQIAAQTGSVAIHYPSQQVCERTEAQYNGKDDNLAHYDMLWKAAIRLLD
jgi:ribulose-5-phosphate 4-epimerase/fuculose-1-phosphate aldolase